MTGPRTGRIADPDYIDIDRLTLSNAIRIYQHWKQLDGEVRAISTRGVNFPSELSEIFACYTLGYLWKKKGGGDALDPSGNRIIEIKGSGSESDDLSSFSPSEYFDELIFIKADKNEDALYIWCTGVDSQELRHIPVNNRKTVGDHQDEGKRPRFSIEKKIIAARGLHPNYKFDIMNKEIIALSDGE